MTIKQKYNGIDQSKLPTSIKKVLYGIKKKTNNFEDSKANNELESKIDKIRTDLKTKYPEALDKSKPASKTKAKSAERSIRKLITDDPILKGFSGSDIIRDKDRKAKPSGKRISKTGNVYYEYRENRTDRYAPEFPKNKPFLAKGGSLEDISESIFFANSKKGKMETSFGDKTLVGITAMIRNIEYSAGDITNALFGSESWRLKTGVGDKSKTGLMEMIEKARTGLKYADGGEVYIDFMNAEKNFETDRKYFDAYDDAVTWAKKEFEKFNPDMINYSFEKGGDIKSRPVYTDFEIDLEDISADTFTAMEEFIKGIGLSSSATTEKIMIPVRHPNNDDSIVLQVKNWFNDNFINYDMPLPFEAGGTIRVYDDLSRAEKNELESALNHNTLYWMDSVGIKIPDKLSGQEYDIAMDETRHKMAILKPHKNDLGKQFITKKRHWLGYGTKVKYPEATQIATITKVQPSVVPNDYTVTALFDDGKKLIEDISSLEIVGEAGFEDGGEVYEEGGEVDNTHNYMLLGRMQMDNDYFLGNGNGSTNQLYYGNVDDQIKGMKDLWNNLPEDGKPEWLSMEDIEDYESKMKSPKTDSNFESGGETSQRYSPLHMKDYVFDQGGEEVTYNGWGIYDNELKAFTNISTDRERKPYEPAGGFSTALEISEMQNNGQIKPEAIYIVTHLRHKFNKNLEKGGNLDELNFIKSKAHKTV